VKSKWLPDPMCYGEKRLFCLDLLRGIDMFYLSVLVPFLRPLFKVLGVPPEIGNFIYDHPWYGFSLYDIIMPLFIFMSGAAVPLAMKRHLESDGRAGWAYHRHVWGRVALLWVLGMCVQGNLLTLEPLDISPYNNTLQTIAVGYLAASYILLIPARWVQMLIPAVLLVVYGIWVHVGGDYTPKGNATVPVEHAILKIILPEASRKAVNSTANGYTWFLPSMIFPVIALAGAQATCLLRSGLNAWRKAGILAGAGAASLVTGLILSALGVATVKHIFTVSFTLQAIGWSMLALAALYVLTDVWKCRRGTGLLLLFGQFALTAYLAEGLFRPICMAFSRQVLGGVSRWVPAGWGDVVVAAGYCVVVVGVLIVRRQLREKATLEATLGK